MTAGEVIAGIDIGGTKTAGALVAPDGTVVARAERETPARLGGDAMAETAAAVVADLAAAAAPPA
ncbi:ROK family protein, partial [Microbacterium sp.]|uniref:ROK family protein n=1 Tax=Microbacterium sp. TaxID=51671 RepID=UPI0039E3505D